MWRKLNWAKCNFYTIDQTLPSSNIVAGNENWCKTSFKEVARRPQDTLEIARERKRKLSFHPTELSFGMKKSRSVPARIDSQSTINGCETSEKWMFHVVSAHIVDKKAFELALFHRLSSQYKRAHKVSQCSSKVGLCVLLAFDEKHFNWKPVPVHFHCSKASRLELNSQECFSRASENNLRDFALSHSMW